MGAPEIVPSVGVFQFTPLREGRQQEESASFNIDNISIHAPPRGATFSKYSASRRKRYFNSRPSARGDGGLTTCGGMQYIFQFTPLREGRQDTAVLDTKQLLFQFTPLREGRPERRKRNERICNFNSRPSARGDSKHGERYTPTPISIHAPPRGATRQSLKGCEFPEFQFTPLREGRLLTSKGMQEKLAISIHAPPRGATIPRMDGRRSAGNFNSRPSARGDIRGI